MSIFFADHVNHGLLSAFHTVSQTCTHTQLETPFIFNLLTGSMSRLLGDGNCVILHLQDAELKKLSTLFYSAWQYTVHIPSYNKNED